MKPRLFECFRRRMHWQLRLMGSVTGLLLSVLSAQAQTDAILPAIGGRGGSQFVARCSGTQLLTGVELVTGDDVDSIRPFCVSAYGPADIGPYEQLPDGVPSLSRHPLVCPGNAPIVTGIYVRSEGRTATIVNNIHLFCGTAATTQRQSEFPAAVFDGPAHAWEGKSWNGSIPTGTQRCPAGLVAVGIHGKSGIWLDSVGLICGAPALTPAPLVIGRVRTDAPAPLAIGRVRTDAPASPGRSICEVARAARARNSPAAPGLEAQCLAAGAAGEVVPPAPKALGTVRLPSTGAAQSRSICDLARAARARNSPAAPGLEAQCRAAGAAGEIPGGVAPEAAVVDLDALAARGEALASEDPLATELRNQLGEASRQGFDIGMGAAEGDTAPGPGKDKIRDSLPPNQRGGFSTAVIFTLERNKYAALARRGAIIAEGDPIVGATRMNLNVFYRLGFDIASGIFGDPAAGALGNTATGPGSLGIRNSLSETSQLGFDASVKLHLSRKYTP